MTEKVTQGRRGSFWLTVRSVVHHGGERHSSCSSGHNWCGRREAACHTVSSDRKQRERDAVTLLISSLFSLSLVSDLGPQDGVVHIEGESSLLS